MTHDQRLALIIAAARHWRSEPTHENLGPILDHVRDAEVDRYCATQTRVASMMGGHRP